MPQTMKLDSERSSEPDSTTAERELLTRRDFTVNDEVLCRIRGDQHYLGIVVQVNHILKKCLVKFLDNTETWCNFKDMKFLNLGEQDITCVVCKTSHNKPNNQLKACACGRGYHQLCHQPHIPQRDPNWRCRICSPTKRKEAFERTHRRNQLPASEPDLNVIEKGKADGCEKQCYCGKKGVWYRGMLQCRRCRRWFHATCLRSLDHKVFWGDRFYIMICAGCNGDKQLCVRLAMTWPDLIHLVLFNLMLLHHTKFFDLDLTIMPYIHRHWPELKLAPALANTAMPERRAFVERSLIENENRFKCGREERKKSSTWGLRGKGAPRPPPFTIPLRGVVDLNVLRLHLREDLLMPPEQPLQNGFINSSKKDLLSTTRSVHSSRSASPDENRSTDFKVASSTTEYVGCGLVKRSVPFPLTEQPGNADARFRNHAVRRAARTLRNRKAKQPLSDSEDETPSTPDAKEKPIPPQDFSNSYQQFLARKEDRCPKPEVKKRPQRNLLEARLNSTESKLYNPQAAVEDQKKKPTTPVETSKAKKLKKGELKNKKTKGKLVQKTILETLQSKKWRSDAKPPDNAIENHHESGSSADERPRQAPPTPVKTVITKRQLSEKDIVVDQHGQVKRRRRHRKAMPPPPQCAPSQRVLRTRDVLESIIKVSSEEFDGGPINMEAVQELLHIPNRIVKGEPYNVIGKRVRPDGKVEALVEFLPRPALS